MISRVAKPTFCVRIRYARWADLDLRSASVCLSLLVEAYDDHGARSVVPTRGLADKLSLTLLRLMELTTPFLDALETASMTDPLRGIDDDGHPADIGFRARSWRTWSSPAESPDPLVHVTSIIWRRSRTSGAPAPVRRRSRRLKSAGRTCGIR